MFINISYRLLYELTNADRYIGEYSQFVCLLDVFLFVIKCVFGFLVNDEVHACLTRRKFICGVSLRSAW